MTPERARKIMEEHFLNHSADEPEIAEAILAACAEQERETWRAALTEAANLIRGYGAAASDIRALRDRGPR